MRVISNLRVTGEGEAESETLGEGAVRKKIEGQCKT